MNIQTISIVVPTKGCINKCKFCVSRMHENDYEDKFDEFQIKKRIKWALMNNINTCVITGIGEPLQNIKFLRKLAQIFIQMDYPFPNVEFQTSGTMLMETSKDLITGYEGKLQLYYKYIYVLKELGVNTISLSVSDLFNDKNNMEIIGVAKNLQFSLSEICNFIKEQGFNLRLSLNLLDSYNDKTPEKIIGKCQLLEAEQVTFRKMYCAKHGYYPQAKWVKEHACNENTIKELKQYIQGTPMKMYEDANGKLLYQLPFGAFVYSIKNMSVVLDDNCMGKEDSISLKFVILRENGKLYSQWDDSGSLLF